MEITESERENLIVQVRCGQCTKEIGYFQAYEDNGGVMVRCPRCLKMSFLANQPLLYPDTCGGTQIGDQWTIQTAVERA